MAGIGQIELPLKLFKRGKVRDVFEVEDDSLLIVSTDRISAFDFVLPSLIPDKGKILNQISIFWFDFTKDYVTNHLECSNPENLPNFEKYSESIEKRSVLVRKYKCFPVEAIVRGYIVGSGWQSYQNNGEISGISLPPGLNFSDKFPEPIFTPTTKADVGHDQDITFEDMKHMIGGEYANKIKEISLKLYKNVYEFAHKKGIIIADTKFEFGVDGHGEVILVDEIFTPDSSRFWKIQDYQPGNDPPAYDKQFVRNYLLDSSWDRKSNPPELPPDVIRKTREKYLEIFKILTGKDI